MAYSAATILALASQCAPTVAPQTVLAIIQTESKGHPLALNVNGARQPGRQTSTAHAITTARRFIAAGYSVDLGLGQINSRNMRWLSLNWETVFDPCTNVAAIGHVLTQNYNAVKAGRDPQTALRIALSMYNTGSQTRGFRNGYVAKVVRNARAANSNIPFIESSENSAFRESLVAENIASRAPAETTRRVPPPKWNLFERAAYERETKTLARHERRGI